MCFTEHIANDVNRRILLVVIERYQAQKNPQGFHRVGSQDFIEWVW
jgi:hypothetical protein